MPKRPLTAAERTSTKKTEKKGEKQAKKEPEPLTMPSLPSCHPSQEALAKRMVQELVKYPAVLLQGEDKTGTGKTLVAGLVARSEAKAWKELGNKVLVMYLGPDGESCGDARGRIRCRDERRSLHDG